MDTDVLGIVAPHPPIMVREVGHVDAEVTARSAHALSAIGEALASYRPETIIVMSPHAPVISGEFAVDDGERVTGSLAAYGAPTVRISASGDPELARAIIDSAQESGLRTTLRSLDRRLAVGELDQGALVPLWFLDRESRAALVVLSVSTVSLADHREFGRAIRRAARVVGRRVAFLASGDCSHRLTRSAPAGWSPRAADFDAELVRLIEANDFSGLQALDPELIEEAGECGLRSFVTLGGFLEGTDAETRVLSYEGPWGVGYLSAIAASPAILELVGAGGKRERGEPREESVPVALARRTIETYVREKRVVEPSSAEGVLGEQHGAFVSLHSHGQLRGCIGTIGPTCRTLGEEIVRNAIEAATADPRFPAVRAGELDDLDISVDVLQEPEPATIADLDPRVWGVIVTSGRRRGLLLPDLEGVDTPEQQVMIARRKAGIDPREPATLERFRVDRYR